jgi:hypothetical protein
MHNPSNPNEETDYFTSGRPLTWQEAILYGFATAVVCMVAPAFGYVLLGIGAVCFVVDGINSYVESKIEDN